MGFASPLLLALLGLSSVDGFWFGGMQERDVGVVGGLERRQMECNSGSTDCGQAGCISTAACCNAAADWSCLEGNACYTVDGIVDCYTTTIPMPTVARACYDYTESGCRGGLTCFQCQTSSIGACVTTVLFSGSDTWLNCYTSSTIKTINVAPGTDQASRTSSGTSPSRTNTSGSTTARPSSTSRPTSSSYSPTQTPDKAGLSGGAIAGIAIGGFAGLTIASVSLFLCFRKKPDAHAAPVAEQTQPQPTYPGYQQPPYQNDPMAQYPPPQPPYSPGPQPHYNYPPAPGMQLPGGYPPQVYPPGIQSPASPVYPEPTKEPTTFPAELSGHQH